MLSEDAFVGLRQHVTEASLPDRDRLYPGSFVDGCTHTLTAWTDGRYPVVRVNNDGGPEPLRGLIDAHRGLHVTSP